MVDDLNAFSVEGQFQNEHHEDQYYLEFELMMIFLPQNHLHRTKNDENHLGLDRHESNLKAMKPFVLN